MTGDSYETARNDYNSRTDNDEQKYQLELYALKRAYEDLDSFISTISHEMKTPLSEIELYAEFIGEDNDGKLHPQSVDDLRSIQNICGNMRLMIQRLMEYSQASFKVPEKKEIDMEILVRQCFNEATGTGPERSIVLTVKKLPAMYGDFFLMHLIFLNVISNSVKFTRNKRDAKIFVSAAMLNGGVEYCIKDNGIGLEQKYANQLFKPFQRLQSESAYEGTGVGLTIVSRIAERFNGKVSINGVPNKGCEVRIWFPEDMLLNDSAVELQHRSSVRIGIIGDFTGRCPLNEQGKIAASRLATDEINETGGINGIPIELLFRDDKGEQELTDIAAKELSEIERVDVLMGSTLSPSRDIIRTYANKNKILYMDTQQTEGGVADHYTFCCSAMPEQQMTKMLEYLRVSPEIHVI